MHNALFISTKKPLAASPSGCIAFSIAACAACVVATFFFCFAFPGAARSEAAAPPAPAPDNSHVLQAGEELEYEVTYLSIRLGRIIIKVDSSTQTDGHKIWTTHAYIDSRPGIPFVSLHTIFESHLDEGGYSRGFVASIKKDDKWTYSKYIFDYPRQTITVEDGANGKIWKKITYNTPYKYNEGLSLYFYARRNAMYDKRVYVPTLVNDDTSRTFIDFTADRQSQSIDAVNYPIDCVHFTGEATWTGIYGLTGKFEGWFSADEACVPIKARMKVYIGSVWIELVKWRRPGWVPPRANS